MGDSCDFLHFLMTTQPTQESIALRIRRIRKDHGWSLADVQKLSKGHFKAVVLGSYERGDRSMSLQRAIDLAALYQVPLHYLIQDEELPFRTLRNALILDLRRVRSHSAVDEKSRLLATFAEWISHQRNDWNGEVMTLRAGDLSLLGLLLFSSEVAVEEWLVEKKLLFTAKGQS